jgi:hypothetical protein
MIGVINDISSGMWTQMSSTTKDQLTEFVANLKSLVEAQSYYYNTEQQLIFLETSETLYKLIYPEIPVNPVKHDESDRIFYLPTDFLMEKQAKLLSFQEELRISYPQINNMSESDYALLLLTAFQASYLYGNTKLDFPLINFLPQPDFLKDCINTAAVKATASITAATTALTIGLAGCAKAINPWAIGGCMIVQAGFYAYAVYQAWDSYNTSVELCNLKYKK